MSDGQRSSMKVYETPPNFNSSYPNSLDWRTKGAVGSVKNQVRTGQVMSACLHWLIKEQLHYVTNN